MEDKIFKVVMIPDNTRIIIDAGESDIEVDDLIEIYEQEIEIKHPDTNEIIGSYTLSKAKLTITDVYENFSIARDEEEKGARNALSVIASPMNTNTYYVYNKLLVNEQDNMNLNTIDKTIKIGDFARIIN